MALLKTKSLEGFIYRKLAVLCAVILLLSGYLAWLLEAKWQWILVTEFLILSICFWYVLSIKQQMMRAFTRASLHVDAITQEDYNQFGKSAFPQGKVKEFHQQLKLLSEKLQTQKSHYDQQAFLVYQLISQLDTPVLIFNQNLIHGNHINKEKNTRWSLNCRFKSIFTPYAEKSIGEFFEPITLRPATKDGMKYTLPKI